MLKIHITPKDIAREKVSHTETGRVIDELAFSVEQWTENDVWENNADYERDCFPTILKEFNYEMSLLEATTTPKKLLRLAKALDRDTVMVEKKTKLQAGAWLALNDPYEWSQLLQAYSDTCEAQADDQYYDSEYLQEFAPKLLEKLEASVAALQSYAHDEWLYGDRSSFGIIKRISDEYDANTAIYDEPSDTFTFHFEEADAANRLMEWNGSKLSVKNYKEYLLLDIWERSDMKFREKQDRRAQRAADYKEREARRKADEEVAEVARIKMLKSLKK